MRPPLQLLALVGLLGGCASSDTPAEPASAARPNILFVFTDDHARHAISAYGSKLGETPHIDRLAQEGMLFRNATVCNSICAPARAAILTGLHSIANGVIDNAVEFDGDQRTFPKLLQGAGYETALIGKWHLKSDPTGFDHWEVLIGQGPYYNPPMLSPAGRREHHGYTTDVITDLALEWLDEGRDETKPFMLMYQHKAPHREWSPAPRYLDLYDDVEMPEPDTLFDDYVGRTSAAADQEMTLARHFFELDMKLRPPGGLDAEQLAAWNAAYGPKNEEFLAAGLEGEELVRWRYQRYVKDYMRCIAAVDENLGRVLDYLDASGLAENTIVIYSSDQGFYLGDHGWYDKRWMYEESFTTPLIARWPGVTPAGSEDEHLVQNIDLAATFLDLAGIAPPADMHGQSLVPILRGEEPEGWRGALYYHYYEYPQPHRVARHYGVRTERYKLIHYYEIDEWELFDLELDPDELTSVHEDPAYSLVRGKLELELQRLAAEAGEPDPTRSLAEIYRELARRRAAGVELQERLAPASPDPKGAGPGDPHWKPMTLAARVAGGVDGVLMSQGGASFGWSFFVRAGRPHFCVRDHDELFEVAADEPLAGAGMSHVAAVLDPDGQMILYVDGRRVADAPGQLVGRRPSNDFAVGADPGSPVGDYEAPFAFDGELADLRVWWGALDESAIGALAGN